MCTSDIATLIYVITIVLSKECYDERRMVSRCAYSDFINISAIGV